VIPKKGEALHPAREPLETLAELRQIIGEFNFAAQYQQAPVPLDGGMVKPVWFKTYASNDLPEQFELVFRSCDTTNKADELSDYSVCTTWGPSQNRLYLRNVFRKRLEYPESKRLVRSHAFDFQPQTVLIEDKASGIQPIQDLRDEGFHAATAYRSSLDKIMRLHTVTSTIENGFVYLPDKAHWLSEYLHEIATVPNRRYDDQVDSTSRALD
jgi:predicted phage terminase large subunit-like protein